MFLKLFKAASETGSRHSRPAICSFLHPVDERRHAVTAAGITAAVADAMTSLTPMIAASQPEAYDLTIV